MQGTYYTDRMQDGFIQELIKHNCKFGKTRADLVIKDVNIKEHHLSRVRKISPIDETRNMIESYNQMIENFADNLTLLLMHNGLQLAELLLILRTRIKPSITLSISTIRQSLHQISPYWWDAEIIGDIIQLASENVGQKNGRIDRLTDEERRLGKSYTAIVQEMRNHYDEHQDRVNRFFYEHTVVCAKLSDGDNIACICYDPRQLDTTANSAIRMRAREALLHFTSTEYTIVLLNLDDCCEIAKLSHGTASDVKEGLQAQLIGESEYAQGLKELVGETCSAQQESQHELVTYAICNKCPQLGKAIVGENEAQQNSHTDTQLPFLNQFP